MKTETDSDSSLTIRCATSFKERLTEYADGKDLTVSQLIRQHFKKLLATTRVAPGSGAARRRKPSTKKAA